MEIPADFWLGAATAAYQIEGGAKEGGRGTSIWDVFSHQPGTTDRGDTGDVACDHYHRYESDIALMKDLGLDAYRFSISWPRLFPNGSGRINTDGVDFYRRILEGLQEASIRPVVTLYHWDLPQKLQDNGGWMNRDTAFRFAEYADAVFHRLGESVQLFITLNEPWCSSVLGHVTGEHAPGVQDYSSALAASHHLLLAHGTAVQAFRESGLDNAKIGLTNVLTQVRPASQTADDTSAAVKADVLLNRWFLNPVLRGNYPDLLHQLGIHQVTRQGDTDIISLPIDFLGVNYYHSVFVRNDPDNPLTGFAMFESGDERTDMGWGVDAKGLYEVITRVAADYGPLPIYITENGAAFEDHLNAGVIDDPKRIAYIRSHLAEVLHARADGVDVRGYFVWSLMDNFEWAKGYSKRFGLYYVDYETQERFPKASANWYRDVITTRHLK
ncbi:GH1 family beta-glucosidase [Alicyclobacillus sp. SO9]|uniref:GH1 family beta-glucosidase n=1 Tax=Alicyclobacillus sp. SO9 TaxID=2665646 RepID=UPI0018E8FF5D|nr:GH1 family beta-glucosidase [Alicyclobacillus sp. SO9]QQE77481.1 beta-glucosidase [Alicyclobacillus sp. SO9]